MTGPFLLNISVFVQPFLKRFALCYWTVVPSDCPVCDVGVLWPNGWIKIKLGMPIGLGPGYMGTQLPKRGTAPNFRSISVVAKWLDRLRCHALGMEDGSPISATAELLFVFSFFITLLIYFGSVRKIMLSWLLSAFGRTIV